MTHKKGHSKNKRGLIIKKQNSMWEKVHSKLYCNCKAQKVIWGKNYIYVWAPTWNTEGAAIMQANSN